MLVHCQVGLYFRASSCTTAVHSQSSQCAAAVCRSPVFDCAVAAEATDFHSQSGSADGDDEGEGGDGDGLP